ncbi:MULTISPECIES: VapA/VapB family virulence-associated protein [Xenorhabdus]|uniref:Virulence-associated protein n=1 Tax=Xenorhabdus ehlersii TaxID=290111 RepID=A0A2D0IUM7_9GAMM|nr:MULTISPECIES: VapA/VapB family virulence-associated protein [Xenorhabdus]MBC8950490.1 hypothetical protein [Xenorhabdus sp. TS4]PHM25592.1 hypothetical protein Xehl_01219 [Xenorhabdus ehlersii]RKE87325.1 virulence-associated protein [Xenorhabdus ehlersii]
MNTLEQNEIKLKLIENFKQTMQGKLEPKLIDEATKRMASSGIDAYSAGGQVESFIFYLTFYLHLDFVGKKAFRGKAGGLTTPGLATIQGFVLTDNLDTLYSDTVSFAFQASPVTFSLHFFDSHSRALGSFAGLAISLITGVGGGTGSWS